MIFWQFLPYLLLEQEKNNEKTNDNNNGFFIIKEGWEYIFVLAVVAMTIATLGPGKWSLDNAFDLASKLDGWAGFFISLLMGVGAGLAQLFIFYRPKKVL